jgi:hypothetical protein
MYAARMAIVQCRRVHELSGRGRQCLTAHVRNQVNASGTFYPEVSEGVGRDLTRWDDSRPTRAQSRNPTASTVNRQFAAICQPPRRRPTQVKQEKRVVP